MLKGSFESERGSPSELYFHFDFCKLRRQSYFEAGKFLFEPLAVFDDLFIAGQETRRSYCRQRAKYGEHLSRKDLALEAL
jgi:hypothetical protein